MGFGGGTIKLPRLGGGRGICGQQANGKNLTVTPVVLFWQQLHMAVAWTTATSRPLPGHDLNAVVSGAYCFRLAWHTVL